MDEHTLNDLLECSVCLERLDTSSKVLPCQHTFCRKCLEVIYASRQELRCPECRILVETKIDDLPPNVLLMRILEGMKNAASKQHSIINEITKETNEKKETLRLLTTATTSGSGGVPANASNHPTAGLNSNISNEERMRQQIQQQQLKQRQQQILQFQQQIQQQHHLHATQNQATITQHQQATSQQQSQQPQSQQNQTRRCIVPHAYALYDFESNEPNDLKFKKGDLILLKRKIDSNWYVGQLKGAEGNFPINYVQIVVPLPTSQCVALYDFKMGPNEEEGCLTFKKGTVIQVLRRVDHNWAEGRIGSSIGIFPIAFVELNQLAKQLLEGFVLNSTATQQQQPSNTHHGPQNTTNNDARHLPPLPPVIDPTLNTNTGDSTTSSSTVSSTTNTASSSSNSSTTTSPTAAASVNPTNSSNSASFHSMPNSPQSSKPSTPQHSSTNTSTNPTNSVRMRNNDLKHKRHSLNALLNNGSTALSIMQTNRHSAEILSVPNDFDNEPTSSTMSTAAAGQTIAAREQQIHSSNIPSASRHNVLKTCVQQNMPPSLPWGYLALYPYKPRKADELELKKGCVYMVTERCLDGWFKGKNWKDVSGVFPGNYVTPLRARDQQQLMHSWKLLPPSATMQSNYQSASNLSHQAAPTINTTGGHATPQQQQQLSPSYPSSMRNDLENINARLTLANLTPHQAMPPDLPPRYMAISPTPTNTTNSNNITLTSKENRDKEAQKEKPTTTGCISTSSSSSSSQSTTSSASAGLKKFLTHIKSRSKSPSAAVAAAAAAASVASIQANVITQSHNNAPPQHQQHNVKSNAPSLQTQMTNMSSSSLTPVHVRSGSCPSQLLQNLPTDVQLNENNKCPTTTNSQQSSPQNQYGSHRIKGPKERASLENTRPTIDSTLRSIYANHIQQQSALMASNKCGQQYQQQPHQIPLPTNSNPNVNNSAIAIHHRKSHSLDASNILQSSPITPTTSSFSNNGAGSGGGVANLKTSSPQCNINAAAIHASATTKSTQNMSESRFRCVVPYPPNSDVELELQVGDIIFVYRKQKNGWYKGTNSRTYKTGLFPASFVEPDL
ncbi:E3 ubiquitin-protein ligase SH3RF1-like isoform X2 [Lucilia sericata]|uniref:E3 ubiquitin-protein ligase SH3RF1-like isoform X2 n=1 Tax=Lucilia sericata TaxID=13632 RepID=UPI0018A7F8E0|nr:E3 ubiquitin-protein ligase SH3RF1-like isoform X2 [Lucilia sericata]